MTEEHKSLETFPAIELAYLREEYANDKFLSARREIQQVYGLPKVDFPTWVLKHLHLRGDERLLDVGCGPGWYVEPLRKQADGIKYQGIDLFPGTLERHPALDSVSQAQAQHLPFGQSQFDVVMANHLLFHIPDAEGTIEEFRRVLKPNGVIVAATNSLQSMPEFQALFRRALVLLGLPSREHAQILMPPHIGFALENGTQLFARQFYAVVRYELPGTLVFPGVDPIVTYLESMRVLYEPQLPENITWIELMAVMRQQIEVLIAHFGELVVNTLTGVLIATDRGGFVQDFVDRHNGTGA